MKKKEYLVKIAHEVFPELESGRFFTKVNGIDYYFSSLVQTDVKNIYRSFYDEFDFAFRLQCTFSLCDRKTDARWIRLEGSAHFYSTPSLFVVERHDFSFAPEQVVSRMLGHYRANTLILTSYVHPQYSEKQLADQMKRNGLNLILF